MYFLGPETTIDTLISIAAIPSALRSTLIAPRLMHTNAGSQGDEWPLPGQLTGCTPAPLYPSHEAASVGIRQSSADDGTALVEVTDQDAKRAPHRKPKRYDGVKSFVERFGIDRDE